MIFFMWIVCSFFVPAHQLSGPNCLRENPGVLDADFSFFNMFESSNWQSSESIWDVTKTDVTKHATLFSTRFKRAHQFTQLPTADMEFLGNGVSEYASSNDKDFQLFISSKTDNEIDQRTTLFSVLTENREIIKKINSGNTKPVVGLYLMNYKRTYNENIKAFEFVFGSKEERSLKLGHAYKDCIERFQDTAAIEYLKRIDFITCRVNAKKRPFPEESAQEALNTCSELKAVAKFLHITAAIMCSVSYPSYGTTTEGVVGSTSDFQRFWCSIVNEILRSKSYPQIIMRSAFDYSTEYYNSMAKYDYERQHDGKYHSGWWRRRYTTSYDTNAFVEKVEELEGGTERINCIPECGYCNSTIQCCANGFCTKDYTFQPFENGLISQVCQSRNKECAPRPPVTKSTSPLFLPPISLSAPTFTLQQNTTSTLSPSTDLERSFVDPFNIVIFAVFALLLVFAATAFLVHRRGKKNNFLTRHEIQCFFEGCNSTGKSLAKHQEDQRKVNVDDLKYDNSLEVINSNFEIYEGQLLGCGAFGLVVKGRVGNDEVAVKTTVDGVDKFYLKALLLELKVLMYLGPHENIVNLHGAHTAKLTSGKLYLFLELCPFGNLLKFLRSNRDYFSDITDQNEYPRGRDKTRLTCKDLLHWSLQIATAMEHLEYKKVIHGDIAARKIFVFSREQVKLTDFGLSRRLYEYSNYVKNNQEPLPWRHMSLEALRDLTFSTQSDVWSFGVTLWEMFSLGEVPYPGQTWSLDYIRLLTEGLRLLCPKSAHPLVYDVMTLCWIADVNMRPHIKAIRSKLTLALNELHTHQLYCHFLDI